MVNSTVNGEDVDHDDMDEMSMDNSMALGPSEHSVLIPHLYTEHILLDTEGANRRTSYKTTYGQPENKRRYRVALDLIPKMQTRHYVSSVKVDLTSGDASYTDEIYMRPELKTLRFSETAFSFPQAMGSLYKTTFTYVPSAMNGWYVSRVLFVPAEKLCSRGKNRSSLKLTIGDKDEDIMIPEQ